MPGGRVADLPARVLVADLLAGLFEEMAGSALAQIENVHAGTESLRLDCFAVQQSRDRSNATGTDFRALAQELTARP